MATQNIGNDATQSQNTGARESAGGHFTQKSQATAEQLKDAATERVEQLRERADSAKGQTAERIRRVGSALRSAGEGLREQDQFVASFADQASQRIDRLADYVGSADPRTLIRDTEELARARPALFLGGAFLLGLAAGRFVKSSDQGTRDRWSSGQSQDQDRADNSGRPGSA